MYRVKSKSRFLNSEGVIVAVGSEKHPKWPDDPMCGVIIVVVDLGDIDVVCLCETKDIALEPDWKDKLGKEIKGKVFAPYAEWQGDRKEIKERYSLEWH